MSPDLAHAFYIVRPQDGLIRSLLASNCGEAIISVQGHHGCGKSSMVARLFHVGMQLGYAGSVWIDLAAMPLDDCVEAIVAQSMGFSGRVLIVVDEVGPERVAPLLQALSELSVIGVARDVIVISLPELAVPGAKVVAVEDFTVRELQTMATRLFSGNPALARYNVRDIERLYEHLGSVPFLGHVALRALALEECSWPSLLALPRILPRFDVHLRALFERGLAPAIRAVMNGQQISLADEVTLRWNGVIVGAPPRLRCGFYEFVVVEYEIYVAGGGHIHA